MKNFVLYIVIGLITTSCKSQQRIIDLESKDIIIFNFKDDTVGFSNNKYNESIIINCNVVITQNWSGYGSHYFKKEYNIVKQQDTMNIKCFCGQERNYYFKNIEFKKGIYELEFKISDYNINGTQIIAQKEQQNILFKNAYPWGESGDRDFRDTYFKDLRFIEIDLADTVNVKLKKVNDEEFKDWRK
jgi:hypothetical protein